ncbi:TonB family protein [Burkholderia aenigmatica]|uniref:TonB family protein n=2 Tax=Burkholderia TaxID=32008 RepID=A0A6J5IVY2_9BURK|nr:energy transducer TonB [Burkholderia aenigmatica]CAB3962819.1 TonB family protein [Burkholderia aenigmatica]
MSTAAFAARETGGTCSFIRDRSSRRGIRVASAVAAVSVLHAGVFVLLARESVVRNVPVQRQVMVAMLIAPEPAPEVSTMTTAAPRPKEASRMTHRVNAAARSSAGREPLTARPVAPVPVRQQAHDALAPPRPAPFATAVERREARHDDATSGATPTQAASQASPASPAPAAPRFVAHPECALVTPDYPPQSLRMGEHGTALVELETDAAGRVVAARVVAGSGYPRLDAAARDAVLASRCAPHVENGAALPMRARAPITFNLDE